MIDFFISPGIRSPRYKTTKFTKKHSSNESRPSTNVSEKKAQTSRTKFFDELSHYYNNIQVKAPYDESFMKSKSTHFSSSMHRIKSPVEKLDRLPDIFKNLSQAKAKLKHLTKNICSEPQRPLKEDVKQEDNSKDDDQNSSIESDAKDQSSSKLKKSDKTPHTGSNSFMNTSRSHRNIRELVEPKENNKIRKSILEPVKISDDDTSQKELPSNRGSIIGQASSKNMLDDNYKKKLTKLINNNLLLSQFCKPLFEKINTEKRKLDLIRNKISEKRRENEEIKKKTESLQPASEYSELLEKFSQLNEEIDRLKIERKSQKDERVILESMLKTKAYDIQVIKTPIMAQGSKIPELDCLLEKQIFQLQERTKHLGDLGNSIQKISGDNDEIKKLIKISLIDKEKFESREIKMKGYLEEEEIIKKKFIETEEKEKRYKERRAQREKTKIMELKLNEKQYIIDKLKEKEAEFNRIKYISRKFSTKTEMVTYFEYIKNSSSLLETLRNDLYEEVSRRKETTISIRNRLDGLKEVDKSLSSKSKTGDDSMEVNMSPLEVDIAKMNTEMASFNFERKQKFLGDIIRAIECLISLLVLYCQGDTCAIKDDKSFNLIQNKIKHLSINRSNISTCLPQISDLILFISKRKKKSLNGEEESPLSPLKRGFLAEFSSGRHQSLKKYKTELNIELIKGENND